MNQALELEPDNRTQEEIKIDRARTEGIHYGIKMVIKEIEEVLRESNLIGFTEYINNSKLEVLKNRLGILVYKNWPSKD